MNGKQLKNSILQWAIQGKLVPQDPNDEPASVLLERIRAEKKRLIKEGKIKKDKNESIIYRGDDNSYYEKFADGTVKCIDEEIPYEAPQGWEWVRISSLFKTTSGGTPDKGHTEYYTNPTIPWLRSGELDHKYVTGTELKISEAGMNNSSAKLFPVNTVVVAMYGATVGQVSILRIETTTNQAICGLFPIKGILPEYLFYFFQAKRSDYLEKAFGSGQPNISQDVIKKTLLPIPPYAEQQRIISIADYISALVDKFDSCQRRLNSLNTSIKANLKKSILQDAIQGRLAPQIATDEPASVLIGRVQKEKERLLKESVLKKKDNVNSHIIKGDDNKYYETNAGKEVEIELPYSFPDSWSIVRLQSICVLLDGEKRTGDGVCLDAKFLRGKTSGDHLLSGKYVHKGDNIILVDGENSGEVFTVPIDGYMGSTFKQLWISSSLYEPYILECIRFYKDELRNSKKGAAIPHLNKDIFRNLIVGIPPFNEQCRIVKRLNELYSIL